MNMDAESREAVGEVLGGGMLDEAAVGPIDPDEPGDAAERELAKLIVADPEKENIMSGVVAKVFEAVQKLDHPGADADEFNNAGCGWAMLAYNEARLDYWPRATAALEASRDGDATSEPQKDRAATNLGHVANARKAMESQ